jgi:hypothetical protein
VSFAATGRSVVLDRVKSICVRPIARRNKRRSALKKHALPVAISKYTMRTFTQVQKLQHARVVRVAVVKKNTRTISQSIGRGKRTFTLPLRCLPMLSDARAKVGVKNAVRF